MIRHLFFVAIICTSSFANAAVIERLVTSMSDTYDDPLFPTTNAEGTLRTVLHDACNDAGDDLIRFDKINISVKPNPLIVLLKPLVIPGDCNGAVTIDGTPIPGTTNPEIKISALRMSGEGGRVLGDLCALNIYSDNHRVANMRFLHNKNGSAVCIFGRNNVLLNNRFGEEAQDFFSPNRFDVVVSAAHIGNHPNMTGSDNQILGNRAKFASMHSMWIEGSNNIVSDNMIADAGDSGIVLLGTGNRLVNNIIIGNGNHGVAIGGSASLLYGNQIEANGGCPSVADKLPAQPANCKTDFAKGGAGVYVDSPASNSKIGGPLQVEWNRIQYNMGGGVVLEDSQNVSSNLIMGNITSNNYKNGIGIDLKDDGISLNDVGDADTGPNTMFNTTEHFQMFPLVGKDRYWGWGVAFDGKSTEVGVVSQEDINRAVMFAGSNGLIGNFVEADHAFEVVPGTAGITTGIMLSSLVHDVGNNTSEYGLSIWVKPDSDLDGIVDDLELISNPDEPDTDFDGLPDSVEDRNRNGICDLGETCAALADTDGDGLSDWAETRGDGRYDPKTDSNPWVADTDGDGLKDGEEDTNNNGVWDGYLGETSPLLADSDQDGFPDNKDTCKMVPNPQQEPWYCEK